MYTVNSIRNICLLGHSGSGKTTLAESLLYMTGAIDRIGTIEPGKDADIAIFDAMPFSNQTLCRFTMIDGVIWNDTLPQNEKTEETNGKRF